MDFDVPEPIPHWNQDPPTEKQKLFLENRGFECPSTKGEASRMIQNIIDRYEDFDEMGEEWVDPLNN